MCTRVAGRMDTNYDTNLQLSAMAFGLAILDGALASALGFKDP